MNHGSSLICMKKQAFCDRVKEVRGTLTQAEFAARCGLTQRHIERMENRKDGKGSVYTAQVAEAGGVSAYWLATGEGERYRARDIPVEAAALGVAWHYIKDASLRDRQAVDLLTVALSFLPTTHPLYKSADKLYRESAKRRGIKAQLQGA
jgi:transcriptional regulator with XRE-family HTH domain